MTTLTRAQKRRRKIARATKAGRALAILYSLLYGLMAFTVFASAGLLFGGVPLMIASGFAALGEMAVELRMMWKSTPGVIIDTFAGNYPGQGLVEYVENGERKKFTRKQKLKLFGFALVSIAAGLTSAIIVSTHAVATLAFIGVGVYFAPYIIGVAAAIVALTITMRMLKSAADIIRDPNARRKALDFFRKLNPNHSCHAQSGKSKLRIGIESALTLLILTAVTSLIMLGVFALGYSGQTIAYPALAHAARISTKAAFAITAVFMIGGTVAGRFAFQIKSSYEMVVGTINDIGAWWQDFNKPKVKRELVIDEQQTHPRPELAPAAKRKTTARDVMNIICETGISCGFFGLRIINASVGMIIAGQNGLTGTVSYVARTGAGLRSFSAVSSVGGEITYNRGIIDIPDDEVVEEVITRSSVLRRSL